MICLLVPEITRAIFSSEPSINNKSTNVGLLVNIFSCLALYRLPPIIRFEVGKTLAWADCAEGISVESVLGLAISYWCLICG